MNDTESDKSRLVVFLYLTLQERYAEMAKDLENENKINKMMRLVAENCLAWPDDKTGRWVGYVQCLLIEVEGVTTTKSERDFTRPLFHELYAASGISIPDSIEI